MDETIKMAERKLFTVISSISNVSNSQTDNNAAEAAEHLAKSILYMYQIKAVKESEEK